MAFQRLTTCALPGRQGGKACSLIRKHDHFTPTREIKRHVRALARNHPEGWKLQEHEYFEYYGRQSRET